MPLLLCVTTRDPPAHRHLALSTNLIEKISSLSGMDNLRILSLGRNMIKKIENLDGVADTLEELWISYNQVAALVSEAAATAPPSSSATLIACGTPECVSPLTLTLTLSQFPGNSPALRPAPSSKSLGVFEPTCKNPNHHNHVQNGIEKLGNLRVLLMSNNKIASWAEIDRLAGLGKLEDLLLIGNPLYIDYKDNNALSDYRIEVC